MATTTMTTTGRTFELTEEQFEEMREESGGYCLACGQEAFGVEPDAEKYECEDCGRPRVYGIEQLLIMGQVEIVGD